jgi:hypothetical protein
MGLKGKWREKAKERWVAVGMVQPKRCEGAKLALGVVLTFSKESWE